VAVTWNVAPWPGFGMEDLSVHGHASLTCHHAMVDVYSSVHPVVVAALVASSSHNGARTYVLPMRVYGV
jgi:hypothetical protein